MIYRAARTADGPALAAMAEASFIATFGANAYPPDDLAAFLATTFGPSGLPAEIDDPAYAIHLAVADDRIVGFAKLGPCSLPAPARASDAELKQLYVLADWHGRGVAAALMAWALATARDAGRSRMVLSVWAENHRAKAFYMRYGFLEIGRNPFRVGEQIDDDRIWSLDL